MTEKSEAEVRGVDQEDGELLFALSKASSSAAAPTAGRELDAFVAEKVMGAIWEPVPTRQESGMTFRESEWLQIPKPDMPDRVAIIPILARRFPAGHTATLPDCPHYSTDIGAAWRVVQRMREVGTSRFKNIQLVEYCYNRTYATFDVEAFYEYDPLTWVEANGENSTAHAICLAALKVIGA